VRGGRRPACRRGRHLAPGKNAGTRDDVGINSDLPVTDERFCPPGWKPRLYGRRDAHRYGEGAGGVIHQKQSTLYFENTVWRGHNSTSSWEKRQRTKHPPHAG